MLRYDIDSYRKLFPVVETGTIYMNHAATAPLSTRVVAAVERYLLERSETRIDNFGLLSRMVSETRDYIAKLINASPDRIAFSDNTSNALNLVAAGIELHAGDRVVLNDLEFPANVYPFLNLKRSGVEIDFVHNRNGSILVDDLEAAVTPRTKLLSISHVQFLSGYRADLEAIGEICRRRGIIFAVDAIQSAGVIPIDVERMKIDFLACGGQKWLMAPQGIGFAFVSGETQERLNQAYVGWTSMKNFFGDFTDYRIDFDDTARRYENGTLNYTGIVSLHESLGTLLDVGIDAIEEHVLDLNDRLIAELELLGMRPYVSGDRRERAGIVSAQVSNADGVLASLAGSKIEVSVRQGWLRISPHFYNTEDELLTVAEKLKAEYHSS